MDNKRMSSSLSATHSLSSRSVASEDESAGKLSGRDEAGGRIKGTEVMKVVIYGNDASYLGRKKREGNTHTHKWKVYLKPYENEDMSVYVKCVQFILHESYDEPYRVIHKPPYTLTETGWGEFGIFIRIFFKDNNEPPVDIRHFLKLFERDEKGNIINRTDSMNSEHYDEIVFREPTIIMYKLLTNPVYLPGVVKHKINYEEKKAKDLEKIIMARIEIHKQIRVCIEKVSTARESISALSAAIAFKKEFAKTD